MVVIVVVVMMVVMVVVVMMVRMVVVVVMVRMVVVVVMMVRMKVKIILVGKGMWTLKEVMMMVVRKIRMRMKPPMTALLPGINYWLKSKLLEATEIGEYGAFWLGGTTQVVILILILVPWRPRNHHH